MQKRQRHDFITVRNINFILQKSFSVKLIDGYEWRISLEYWSTARREDTGVKQVHIVYWQI
jgi:hypothetical protein